MYLRKTTRTYKNRTYVNHLLVESVHTAAGPRQRTICSLGNLAPGPAERWLGVAHKLEAALQGQASLPGATAPIEDLADRARQGARRTRLAPSSATIDIQVEQVGVEDARAAGPVHVGHQGRRQLRIDALFRAPGLAARA